MPQKPQCVVLRQTVTLVKTRELAGLLSPSSFNRHDGAIDPCSRMLRGPDSGCLAGHPLAASAFVKGFGCRPIAAMRLAPWPASESLQ